MNQIKAIVWHYILKINFASHSVVLSLYNAGVLEYNISTYNIEQAQEFLCTINKTHTLSMEILCKTRLLELWAVEYIIFSIFEKTQGGPLLWWLWTLWPWNIDFSLRTKTLKQFVKEEMLRWGQCFCFTITKKQFLKLIIPRNVEDFDKIRKNNVTLTRDNTIFKVIIVPTLNEFCSWVKAIHLQDTTKSLITESKFR